MEEDKSKKKRNKKKKNNKQSKALDEVSIGGGESVSEDQNPASSEVENPSGLWPKKRKNKKKRRKKKMDEFRSMPL